MPAFKSQIVELTTEEAYEEASRLTESSRQDGAGATVFRGIHPQYGPVYITIPVIGDSMLLPTEFRAKPVLIQGDLAKVA